MRRFVFLPLNNDYYLRTISIRDVSPRWVNWLNDRNTNRYQSHGSRLITLEQQSRYVTDMITSHRSLLLGIFSVKSGLHVGNVSLNSICYVTSSAHLGILLGDDSYRGIGLGSLSWLALTRYARNSLGLSTVFAEIARTNEPSIRCALKAGFVFKNRSVGLVYNLFSSTPLDLYWLPPS